MCGWGALEGCCAVGKARLGKCACPTLRLALLLCPAALWALASSYYLYITFLGYSALPFLERTEVSSCCPVVWRAAKAPPAGGARGCSCVGIEPGCCTVLRGVHWTEWSAAVAAGMCVRLQCRVTAVQPAANRHMAAGVPIPHRSSGGGAAAGHPAGGQPHAACAALVLWVRSVIASAPMSFL